MKTQNLLSRPSGGRDCKLCWTMRVVGIVLAITAIAFMTQDIFTSDLSMWFFGLCIGLGVITTITSWMPGPVRARLHDRAALQPVVKRSVTHHKTA